MDDLSDGVSEAGSIFEFSETNSGYEPDLGSIPLTLPICTGVGIIASSSGSHQVECAQREQDSPNVSDGDLEAFGECALADLSEVEESAAALELHTSDALTEPRGRVSRSNTIRIGFGNHTQRWNLKILLVCRRRWRAHRGLSMQRGCAWETTSTQRWRSQSHGRRDRRGVTGTSGQYRAPYPWRSPR